MKKISYYGVKGSELFTAFILHEEESNICVLFLAGDGTSDAVSSAGANEKEGMSFEQFLEKELPESVALIIDVTYLYMAKSLLHKLLATVCDDLEDKVCFVFEGNNTTEDELIIPLERTFGIERNVFSSNTLKEVLREKGASEDFVVITKYERSNIKAAKPLMPEMDFFLEALGKSSVVDAHIAKLFQGFMNRYNSGAFQHEEGMLVLTQKLVQPFLYKYLHDLLENRNLLDPYGKDPMKLKPTRLEFIVKELFRNSREHGYNGSGHGMIYVHHIELPDRLLVLWDDFGGTHNNPDLKGGGVGLREIEHEIHVCLGDESKKDQFQVTSENQVKMKKEETERLIKRIKEIKESVGLEGSLIPPGNGFRVVLPFPVVK